MYHNKAAVSITLALTSLIPCFQIYRSVHSKRKSICCPLREPCLDWMLGSERSIVKLRKKKRREWHLRLSCPRIGVTLHLQRLIDMAYLVTWEAIICNWTNHWILTQIKAQPTEEQTWYRRVITIQSSCNQSNRRVTDTKLFRITIHLWEWWNLWNKKYQP